MGLTIGDANDVTTILRNWAGIHDGVVIASPDPAVVAACATRLAERAGKTLLVASRAILTPEQIQAAAERRTT